MQGNGGELLLVAGLDHLDRFAVEQDVAQLLVQRVELDSGGGRLNVEQDGLMAGEGARSGIRCQGDVVPDRNDILRQPAGCFGEREGGWRGRLRLGYGRRERNGQAQTQQTDLHWAVLAGKPRIYVLSVECESLERVIAATKKVRRWLDFHQRLTSV